ncbi:MAG: hypothetical protein ACI4JE_00755 [Ruminococcus sp.]
MKKILSAAAAVLGFTITLSSVTAYAAPEQEYTPLCYFVPDVTDEAEMLTNNIIHIPSSMLENGDYTLSTGVFIEDKEKRICYAASLKWSSDSEYIKLSELYDPTTALGEYQTYTTSEGREFRTNSIPFAYGSINDQYEMEIPYSVIPVVKDELDEMAFTYQNAVSSPLPLKTLGATSDEYPFAVFNAVISSDTPSGKYSIYFNTQDNTSGDRSRLTHIGYLRDEFDDIYPRTADLTIIVGDYLLGDTTLDGTVNAIDASSVLRAYANTATGAESGLDEFQTYISDTDHNGIVDAVDASTILGYYAFISTGGSGTLEDYISSK